MKEQINTNEYRKSRLLQVVDTQLQYDQYRQVLDALEVQVEQSYMKRFVSIEARMHVWDVMALMMHYTSEYKRQRNAKRDHQQKQAYLKTPLPPWRSVTCLSKSLVLCLWIRTLYCHPTLFTTTTASSNSSIKIIQEPCTFITFPTHCVIPTPAFSYTTSILKEQTIHSLYDTMFIKHEDDYYDDVFKLLHRLRKQWAY